MAARCRWLHLLVNWSSLSLLLHTSNSHNTTHAVGKDSLWQFLRSGGSTPSKLTQNQSVPANQSLEFSNVSLENLEEDLLSIRDLDNLFTYENFSSTNLTLEYNVNNEFDPNLNRSLEVSKKIIDSNAAVGKSNSSNETTHDQLDFRIPAQNEKYLSKFSVKAATGSNTKEVEEVNPTEESLYKPEPEATWPVKLSAEVPGDLILGGLMMVHEREDSVTCGPVMPQGGIQALETMLYTLDVINSQPSKPFTLGAHILDDCDKDTYGLEMAVDFIKGKCINSIKTSIFYNNKSKYAVHFMVIIYWIY